MPRSYVSRYESTWQQLKRYRRVTLKLQGANIAPRIVKAIRKRKNLDTLYRVALSSQQLKDRLSWRILPATPVTPLTPNPLILLEISLTLSPISFADKI